MTEEAKLQHQVCTAVKAQELLVRLIGVDGNSVDNAAIVATTELKRLELMIDRLSK